ILKKDDQIITYCASSHCPASTMAADKLQKMGYKNVVDFKGGLEDYKKVNFPLERGGISHKREKICHSCC
ncbi:MAG: rhodanese-like domain-containing protein, partial [Candidatus Omnitrophica bacterium]|nr:rhodanese-like domain-containing protein [Candidatus Omnitrophota bacterium]